MPDKKIVGALDMGGSSNQLILHSAEIKNAQTSQNGEPVTQSDFWSHSWLNFGVERVQQKLVEYLTKNHSALNNTTFSKVVSNPCGFVGHEAVHGEHHVLLGTGDVQACREILRNTLWDNVSSPESETGSAAYGVDGVVSPKVDDHEFYAMSVYFYALDCIRHLLGDEGSAHFSQW